MRRLLFFLFLFAILLTVAYSCSRTNSNPDASRTLWHNDSLKLSKAKGFDVGLLNMHRDYRSSDPEKAYRAGVMFLAQLDTAVHSPVAAAVAEWIGKRDNDNEKTLQAIARLRKAYGDFSIARRDSDAGRVALTLSHLYIVRGRNDSAFLLAARALDAAEKYNSPDREIEASRLLGVIYTAERQPEMANRYFQSCVDKARSLPDSAVRLRSLMNSSVLNFLADGKPDRSLLLMRESEKMSKPGNVPPRIYLNMAGVYIGAGDYSQAREYADKASAGVMSRDEKAQYHKILAMIKIENDSNAEAIPEVKAALQIYDTLANDPYAMEMNAALAYIYSQLGDDSNALFHFQRLRQLQNSEDRPAISAAMNRLSLERELSLEKKRSDEAVRRYLWYSTAITAALVLAAAAAVWMVAKRQYRRRLEKASLDFDRRIENIRHLNLVHTDTSIRNALAELDKTPEKSQETENARKILNARASEVLNEINSYLGYLDSEKFRQFISEHPTLTPNECKIAVFVSLQITTKQMSEITGQSVAAINMAKLRLRRKLGLTNSNMRLTEYLNRFNMRK